MNLLVHLRPAEYDPWKAEFDAAYEERMQSGLTLMQLWRGVDGGGVTALFDLNDRADAQAWLDRERARGAQMDARFLVNA